MTIWDPKNKSFRNTSPFSVQRDPALKGLVFFSDQCPYDIFRLVGVWGINKDCNRPFIGWATFYRAKGDNVRNTVRDLS